MDTALAIKILVELRSNIEKLHPPHFSESSPEFVKWRRDTKIAIENIFGGDIQHSSDFSRIQYSVPVTTPVPASEKRKAYIRGLNDADAILSSMIKEIHDFGLNSASSISANASPAQAIDTLERLLVRFPLVVNQLRLRHDKRTPLTIEDEYDVQDLLHALLRIFFDDVRDEEDTPSCAGGSARADFILKNEKIFIEVKKTREKLGSKEIRKQLADDIVCYQSHSDCEQIVCFIYDPDMIIENPVGFKSDFEKTQSKIPIRVIVAQK